MRVAGCFVLLMMLFGLSANAQTPEPDVAAQGAILMDAATGRVLWGKNEHTPLAMASTTKIMTAVLVLESGRLDEIVTVSRAAAATPKVKMNLTPGEKIALRNLLHALMLESSNDAAVAIAEHLSPDGTVAAFCRQMTEKAQSLGAVNTVFETPNGLDAGYELHRSTAYDLAVIARYAMTVPGFETLINTTSAAFASDKRAYLFHNKNRLLHEYHGANGIKTGFTNKAGHCFVGTAKRDDMLLISVVLASGWGERGRAQKWTDTKRILNYGFECYDYVTVLGTCGDVGNIPVARSRTAGVRFAYADPLVCALNTKNNERVTLRHDIPTHLPAPVTVGQRIGTASLYVGDDLEQKYAEVALLATEAADRHDLDTTLRRLRKLWLSFF